MKHFLIFILALKTDTKYVWRIFMKKYFEIICISLFIQDIIHVRVSVIEKVI